MTYIHTLNMRLLLLLLLLCKLVMSNFCSAFCWRPEPVALHKWNCIGLDKVHEYSRTALQQIGVSIFSSGGQYSHEQNNENSIETGC